jgi:RNA polymerase sigma-70 factor, ECF subfamily
VNPRPADSISTQLSAARPPAEEDLVRRVRAGDADAFACLFNEHFASLCGFVLSYVRDPAAAEELVQDLFCSIWRQRADWAPEGQVRHYLLASARNRSITWLRHQRVVRRGASRWHAFAAAGEVLPGMGASPTAPDRSAESAEMIEQCRQAIHTLPERQRLVVTLRWQHQMSHGEIGRMLGISVKTVEAQLSRALKSLRRRLSALHP